MSTKESEKIRSRRRFLRLAGATALAGTAFGCASQRPVGTRLDAMPRLRLTTLPTALNAMKNLSRTVGGADLYIKRDDVMELAHGGNKTRKLEYALAEALATDAGAVVTQGGLQSNHVRQTCSGAAKVGLEAHVILSNPVPEMREALTANGNYLMDQLMGAHIYHAESGRGPVVERVMHDLTTAGRKPYNIPAGASNGIGSLGYVNAARELIDQWRSMGIRPSHVFTASGSCGTQAGLLLGLRYFGNTTTEVVGVSVSGQSAPMRRRVRRVMDEIGDVAGIPAASVRDDEILVADGYIGRGYGYPTDAGIAAMRLVAETEGVILDPIYTGKAMSALLDMLRSGTLSEPRDVVFLHTGGAPAIHPYADYLRTS